MFSRVLAPLKTIWSLPAWPSMTSEPSPGSQRKTSSPLPTADVEGGGVGRGVGAFEEDAAVDGGRAEGFSGRAAVDLRGVEPVAALVHVGAVAGVPDHQVIAGVAVDFVGSRAAGQGVV